MNVIWHDNECIQVDRLAHLRGALPFATYKRAQVIVPHVTVDDVAEQAYAVKGTKRNKICSR